MQRMNQLTCLSATPDRLCVYHVPSIPLICRVHMNDKNHHGLVSRLETYLILSPENQWDKPVREYYVNGAAVCSRDFEAYDWSLRLRGSLT